MRQGELPYQYIPERSESGMTSLAGLPAYLDLLHVMGLRESIDSRVRVRAGSQGWSDSDVIVSLITA